MSVAQKLSDSRAPAVTMELFTQRFGTEKKEEKTLQSSPKMNEMEGDTGRDNSEQQPHRPRRFPGGVRRAQG